MKTDRSGAGFRIGPGMPSLLMILVTLLMAALAILAMAGAQTDAALSQRNLETTLGYYQAAAEMQRELAEIDRLLADARTAAAGDAGAYEQLVRDLRSSHLAQVTEDDEGLLLLVAVPMENHNRLEALLRAPPRLTGPRYAMVSHKLTDDAPWELEQDLFVFVPDEIGLLDDFEGDADEWTDRLSTSNGGY